ncbi:MAG: hypothetical protein HF967_03600 [Methanosarcinales archaeon]|nr:hypothetical protein [Methanosarcinales archaeon]
MKNELTKEKLDHLIQHWITHNKAHSKSFNEWIEKLKIAGFTNIVNDIHLASEKMDESTKYLINAKDKLK